MVKLNFTKTTEKELIKLAELSGFTTQEEYLENQILLFLLNELTSSDVENTKQKIKVLQETLQGKREEILLELREQKVAD